MDKSQLGKLWVGVIVAYNIVFFRYLQIYQEVAGFVFGIPEALLVFLVLIAGIVAINSIVGWLYLGKPDLTELFTLRTDERTASSSVTEDH